MKNPFIFVFAFCFCFSCCECADNPNDQLISEQLYSHIDQNLRILSKLKTDYGSRDMLLNEVYEKCSLIVASAYSTDSALRKNNACSSSSSILANNKALVQQFNTTLSKYAGNIHDQSMNKVIASENTYYTRFGVLASCSNTIRDLMNTLAADIILWDPINFTSRLINDRIRLGQSIFCLNAIEPGTSKLDLRYDVEIDSIYWNGSLIRHIPNTQFQENRLTVFRPQKAGDYRIVFKKPSLNYSVFRNDYYSEVSFTVVP